MVPMAKGSKHASRRSQTRPAHAHPDAAAPLQRRRAARWPMVLLIVVGTVVFANNLSGPFVFDDRGTIIDNHTIESLTDPAVLNAPFETPTAGRPVANLSFALNYAVGGREVTGYHLVNIAIHLGCALLLFALVAHTLRRQGPALAIALIWLVHPLAGEPVNYLTQRTESLMAFFYLLTLYASARSLDAKRPGRWEMVAVISCILGMATKESMVTAPILVVAYDFVYASFHGGQWGTLFGTRKRLYGGLVASWVVLAGLVSTAPRSLSAGFTTPDSDLWTYLLNQTVVITHYLKLAVWPDGLALYYGWPVPLTVSDVLPQAVFVVGLLAATVWALLRHPRVGVLCAAVFLTLAPTSSVLPIVTEVGAERRMYLALMAIITLVVMGWDRLRQRDPFGFGEQTNRLITIGVLSIVVFGLAGRTILRNRDYHSSLRLAETTVEHWPSPAGHSMLGTELANASRFIEAESHLRTATAAGFPPARYYLATVLMQDGKVDEAIREFTAYIASQPDALEQVHLARSLLANAYRSQQRWGEAAVQYRAMLSAHPDDTAVHALLANTLVRVDAFPEAITHYERYLAVEPNDATAVSGLAIAYSAVGRTSEAVAMFRRVVDLDPTRALGRLNLARALAGQGEMAEAIAQAEAAVQLAPEDEGARALLAQLKAGG